MLAEHMHDSNSSPGKLLVCNVIAVLALVLVVHTRHAPHGTG